MAKQLPSQPEPNSGKGFYWDEAIVFAPHVRWDNASSVSFWEGPVYRVMPGLEGALSTQ